MGLRSAWQGGIAELTAPACSGGRKSRPAFAGPPLPLRCSGREDSAVLLRRGDAGGGAQGRGERARGAGAADAGDDGGVRGGEPVHHGAAAAGGTWSKWYLATAAVDAEEWVLLGVLLPGSLLSMGYLLTVPMRVFSRATGEGEQGDGVGERGDGEGRRGRSGRRRRPAWSRSSLPRVGAWCCSCIRTRSSRWSARSRGYAEVPVSLPGPVLPARSTTRRSSSVRNPAIQRWPIMRTVLGYIVAVSCRSRGFAYRGPFSFRTMASPAAAPSIMAPPTL